MFFPNLNIPIAGNHKYHHSLPAHHITSCNFGQPAPIYYRYLGVGDSIKVNPSFTIRTQPLVLPTYGNVFSKLHAFFVPYRLIYPNYSKWLEGQNTYFQSVDALPTIKLLDICELFTDTLCAPNIVSMNSTDYLAYPTSDDWRTFTDPQTPPDSSDYTATNLPFDFCVWHQAGSTGYWRNIRLTNLGRYWLRIFNSLGISWNWLPMQQGSIEIVSFGCFLKAYLDFFVPSQLQNAHPIAGLLQTIQLGQWRDNMELIVSVIKSLPCAYDADYFTSAWAYFDSQVDEHGNLAPNPFSGIPTSSLGRPDDDNSTNFENINNESNVGSYISQENSDSTFTAFGLRVLRAVDNYLTRNNWAGSRATERLLARFGIKVPEYRFNYTEYVGSDATSFNISDVTNLTESEAYDLGSYAGKMWCQGNAKTFQYEANEPGLFIILHAIMPEIQYWQGLDRLHLCVNRFDYYTPEFDSIGNDAIPVAEAFQDFQLSCTDSAQTDGDYQASFGGDAPNEPSKVFGFLPRFTHFKVPRSWLSGAYRVPSLRREIEAFNLFRTIRPNDAIRAQGNFLFMDSSEYDKIFSVDESLSDKFFPSFNFAVDLESKMKSISDSIPLDDGSGNAPANSNGAILN